MSDTYNDRVLVFWPGGGLDLEFGRPGDGGGRFSAPSGVSWDAVSGRIAVADAGNDRVQVFSVPGAR